MKLENVVGDGEMAQLLRALSATDLWITTWTVDLHRLKAIDSNGLIPPALRR